MSTGISLQKNSNKQFYWFLAIWFIHANILNYFIDVSGEEAYYWIFGQYPAWGYLDHPPMVGWISGLGYWLIPNAMGLRLFLVVLSCGIMYMLRELMDRKNDKLLIWIFLGLLPLHVSSVIVKTDVPLIFFMVLFFYGYKDYLRKETWKNSVLIAISIAGVMLSKHHGFLVILFVVLSNLTLLKKRSFWGIVAIVTILMLPHLFWQIANDFATFKFHLYNRTDMDIDWTNTLYFLVVQPIAIGPLIGFLLFFGFFKTKTEDLFVRGMKFSVYGVLVFFFYVSFKVQSYPHWTSVIAIPVIFLGFQYINGKAKLEKRTLMLSKISLVLLLIAKVYLAYDFFPKSWTKDWEQLHHWQSWADEVKELSGGLPVVFEGNYERSSRYYYLSKDVTHCYNPPYYRETQHDLWGFEDDLQGKDIFYINRWGDSNQFKSFTTSIGKEVQYRVIENFRSYRHFWIEMLEDPIIEGKQLTTRISLMNRSDQAQDFEVGGESSTTLMVHFLKGLTEVARIELEILEGVFEANGIEEKKISFEIPEGLEKFDIRFSVQTGDWPPPINGPKYQIELGD